MSPPATLQTRESAALPTARGAFGTSKAYAFAAHLSVVQIILRRNGSPPRWRCTRPSKRTIFIGTAAIAGSVPSMLVAWLAWIIIAVCLAVAQLDAIAQCGSDSECCDLDPQGEYCEGD